MTNGHAEHHVQPVSLYVKTFLLLILFMGLTIFASRLQVMNPNGFWMTTAGTYAMNFIALAIACIKAYLVISIFMGVKFGTPLIKLYAVVGFVWALFIGGFMVDYTTRKYELVKGWDENPPASLPRSTIEDKREYTETGKKGPIPNFR